MTASQQIAGVGVPERASIMLMGTMLLLTGVGLRRKLSGGAPVPAASSEPGF